MYLSISTWLWDHFSVDAMIDRVIAAGFDAVEVSGTRWPHLWPPEELARLLGERGIRVASIHASDHEHTWTDEDSWRRFQDEWYATIAPLPDGSVVVQHTSMAAADLDRDVARLQHVCGLADAYGFRVAIENLPQPGTAGEQTDTMAAQLDAAPVGFTLDGLHAAALGVDPLALLDSFGDRLVNVHVVDWDPTLPLGDWLPPGRGLIDWPAIVARLAYLRYQGPLTIELNHATLRHLAETISPLAPGASAGLEGFEDAAARWSLNYLSELL